MAKPEYHVFICSQQRPKGHPRGSCGERGATALIQEFSQEIITRNLLQKVSIVPTACLGPCDFGANVLVYPGAVLYCGVTVDDIDDIIERHLIGGEPVTEKMAPADLW